MAGRPDFALIVVAASEPPGMGKNAAIGKGGEIQLD